MFYRYVYGLENVLKIKKKGLFYGFKFENIIKYSKSQMLFIERFLIIKFNFTVYIIDIMFSKSDGIVKHIFKLWQYTRNLSKNIQAYNLNVIIAFKLSHK